MKIVSVVGARPQFIKAAAVTRALGRFPRLTERLIHTGQHFDDNMSEVFFRELEIPEPAYHLGINSLSHAAMTGKMLIGLEPVLQSEHPDIVLVYGDTNSTLAGALAAAKLRIPVGHIEAGLRSFRMDMPEELNRTVADHVASMLFCPTDAAVGNLKAEGVERTGARVIKVGDVMYDVALYYAKLAARRSTILQDHGLKLFALCTIHRAENTDNSLNLRSILDGLDRINHELPVVMPIHPRTRKAIEAAGLTTAVNLIDPVGYFDMLQLVRQAEIILTDSGGLQKEAFFFQKPCVTLRDETEWVELVEDGANVLAGADSENIYRAFCHMRGNAINKVPRLYGDGDAADKIAEALMSIGR